VLSFCRTPKISSKVESNSSSSVLGSSIVAAFVVVVDDDVALSFFVGYQSKIESNIFEISSFSLRVVFGVVTGDGALLFCC